MAIPDDKETGGKDYGLIQPENLPEVPNLADQNRDMLSRMIMSAVLDDRGEDE